MHYFKKIFHANEKHSTGLVSSLLFLLLAASNISEASYPFPEQEREKPQSITLDLETFYVFEKKHLNVAPGASLFFSRKSVEIDLGYQYSFPEKTHYYRLSSLELKFPFLKKFLLSFGFKNHLWSKADRYWNYGLWQPRYMVDPLRPKQMGLPGLYLNYEGTSSLLFYVSALAFPNLIVRPRFIKGKPLSENPFFIAPFLTKESKFHWDLEQVKAFRITDILKPGAGFQIRHKLPFSQLSLSYAYKPSHDLHYSILMVAANKSNGKGEASERLDLSELPALPRLDQKSQTEKPKLFSIKDFDYSLTYHHLATLEAEMMPLPHISVTGSLIYESPESQPLKGTAWISENRESHLTTAVLLQMKEAIGSQTEAVFTLAYSHVFEIESKTANSNVWLEPYESFFTGGTDWKNALAAALSTKTQALFKGYDFNIRLNYALDNKLYLINFENKAFISPDFRIYLSGDLFFRLAEKNIFSSSSSDIIRFQELSRILVGAEYVF